jgi:DNA mismatch endonuclease (patch repair protein)
MTRSGAALPVLPPAPPASSGAVLRRMRLQPRSHTSCEFALRSALHRLGLRFRVDCRPIPNYRRRADIVFPRLQVAVFVDGCFWHGCRWHKTTPAKHREWWCVKIHRNRLRDRQTTRFLRRRGWTVIRVWEHASIGKATSRVLWGIRRRA